MFTKEEVKQEIVRVIRFEADDFRQKRSRFKSSIRLVYANVGCIAHNNLHALHLEVIH